MPKDRDLRIKMRPPAVACRGRYNLRALGSEVAIDHLHPSVHVPAGGLRLGHLPVFAGGDGELRLTKAWDIRGAFNHNWDPYWSTSLFGSYAAVRYDDTAKLYYCAEFTAATGGLAAKSADYSCNPDFNVSQLGLVTRWTHVKNLTFSAEVQWFHRSLQSYL